MNEDMILVVGASGSIGGRVTEALVEQGLPVRASSRHELASGYRGSAEIVIADYDDVQTLSSVASGVRTAFLYTPTRNAEDIAKAFRDAGVERVVMLSSGSVLLPGAEHIPSAQMHRSAEAAFAGEISEFLPVRPLRLSLDALRWASSIRERGEVSLYRSDALSAPLHEQDVVDMIVHALTTGDQSATAAMSGPALLTQADQIRIISATISREIKIHEQTADEAFVEFARHGSAQAAKATIAFLDNAAAGRSPVLQTIPSVLGRSARSFQTWTHHNRESFIS